MQIGALIAEEFKSFTAIIKARDSNSLQMIEETEVMKYCCQFSAIFSEFSKVLFGKLAFGPMLLEFINLGGLESVFDIIRWLVKYLYELEHNGKPKSLN